MRTSVAKSVRNLDNGALLEQAKFFYLQRSLPQLIAQIRILETRTLPPNTLGEAYLNVVELAWVNGRFSTAMTYALKMVDLSLSPADEITAHRALQRVCRETSAADSPEAPQARGQLIGYVQRADLFRLQPSSRNVWFEILINYLPEKFFSLKEQLGTSLLALSDLPESRAGLAGGCLLNARRRLLAEPAAQPPAAAADWAAVLLREMPSLIADPRLCDRDRFHSLIFSLIVLNLTDQAEEALRLRPPETGDPVGDYVMLKRLSLDDLERAAVATMEHYYFQQGTARVSHQSGSIADALSILRVQVVRQYFETKLLNPLDAPPLLPMGDEVSLPTEYFLAPRGDRPEALEIIRRARRQALSSYLSVARHGGIALRGRSLAISIGQERGQRPITCFALIDCRTRALELYIPMPDGHGSAGYIKAKYPFTYDGEAVNGINPQTFFAVPEQQQQAVPLVWEIVALRALPKDDRIGYLDELKHYLTGEAEKLDRQRAAARRSSLTAAVADDERFREGEIDLANRLVLAKMIVGEFPREPRSGMYRLTDEDPLNQFFQRAEISLAGRRLTATLVGRDETDRLSLEFSDWRELLGEGAGQSLFDRYLQELILSALIKLSYNGHSAAASAPAEVTGYVIHPDLPSGRKPELGLERIYSRLFFEQLREPGGLLRKTLYYREAVGQAAGEKGKEKGGEYLYWPVPDQTREGRTKAITEHGEDNLFIAVRKKGTIKRLPVREVRRDGRLVIAPQRRNPNRILQQEIFGETGALPDAAGLYVVTVFNDGKTHLRRVHIRDREDELQSLIAEVEAAVAAKAYEAPVVLLENTGRESRDRISRGMTDGTLKIVRQSVEKFFPIESTYHRPQMTSLSALRAKGFVIE